MGSYGFLWVPMGSYGFLYFFPPILKQTGCFAGRHDEEVPSGTSAHAARSCAPTARAGKAKRFFTGSMRKTKTNLGSKSLVSIHFRYSLKISQIFPNMELLKKRHDLLFQVQKLWTTWSIYSPCLTLLLCLQPWNQRLTPASSHCNLAAVAMFFVKTCGLGTKMNQVNCMDFSFERSFLQLVLPSKSNFAIKKTCQTMPKIIDKRSPRSTRASLHGIGTLQARLADPKTWSVSRWGCQVQATGDLLWASWLFYMGYREPPHMWQHCTCGDQKPWIPTIPDFWSSDGHACRSFLFHPMFGAQTCSITTK